MSRSGSRSPGRGDALQRFTGLGEEQHREMFIASMVENYVNTSDKTRHLGADEKDHTYSAVMAQLGLLSIVPQSVAELHQSKNRETRALYREGMDRLVQQQVNESQYMAAPAMEDINVNVSSRFLLPPTSFPIGGSDQSLLAFGKVMPGIEVQNLRFEGDFIRKEFLGKGGFGSVWRCQQKTDDQVYAVKTIVLNSAIQAMAKSKGPQNLDSAMNKILKEARTLARLDHCNVVRYYGSWVAQVSPEKFKEQNQGGGSSGGLSSDFSQPESGMTTAEDYGSSVSAASLGLARIQTVNTDSIENESASSSDDESAEDDSNDDSLEVSHAESEEISRRMSDAEVIEEISEEVMDRLNYSQHYDTADRDDDLGDQFKTSIFKSEASDDPFEREAPANGISVRLTKPPSHQLSLSPSEKPDETLYVLYIQMSLHPTSLSEYLTKPMEVNHNFNPCASLRLIQKIMDGVEYLHYSKLIHRDLKPANIFLSLERTEKGMAGGVQVGGCHCNSMDGKCRRPSGKHPCEEGHLWLVPRIGDFGLVSELDPDDVGDNVGGSASRPSRSVSKNVGTSFYRPPVNEGEHDERLPSISKNPCEKTDVYALGVTLFELLYQMDTGSERMHVLSKLTKRSAFDEDFFPKDFPTVPLPTHDFGNGQLLRCISSMTHTLKCERFGLKDAQASVREILESNLFHGGLGSSTISQHRKNNQKDGTLQGHPSAQ